MQMDGVTRSLVNGKLECLNNSSWVTASWGSPNTQTRRVTGRSRTATTQRSRSGRTRAVMTMTVRRQRMRSDEGYGAEARHAQGLQSGSSFASSSESAGSFFMCLLRHMALRNPASGCVAGP